MPIGRLDQPVLVVLEEPVPRAGVTPHEVQHGRALARDKLARGQRAGQQLDRLAGLPQALLAPAPQAVLVQGEAAQQVLAQGARGPDAELRSALRVDAVADGEDGVEVEGLDAARDLAAALALNCCKNATVAARSNSPLAKTLCRCREMTDLCRPNSAASWSSDSQAVSCSSRTSTRTSPSGDW